ncbi:AMP-binding protein [Tessaracoccus sp. ZS01]|uniref:AMP-binding protein n=1 Tax=Tessaracoccus sp. ZS01 TaxID=1906324 RepID=UPI00096D0391|nr:AMP-binding protein [Tessaracoccus sp. ZS01]MCG6566712.1 long-chain fatty acid--CoA ligase [Tessaracoccus sp. ZS01]OMG59242.1 long-chain fatty acid--CoA ligase [Tessaracoccus sp. ZS01]
MTTTPLPAPDWTRFYQPGVPAQIELPTESLTDMCERSCREGASKVATEFFGGTMTYTQLGERIDRAAEGLRRLGVVAGDRVAILLPNCPQHLVAFYAILRLGAVVCEHNPLSTERELEEVFIDHGAKVAIALDRVLPKVRTLSTKPLVVSVNLLDEFPTVKRLLLGLPVPSLRQKRAQLTDGSTGDLTWKQLLAGPALDPAHPRPTIDDLGAIQYTSGTTGVPKGVMLTHLNMYANALMGAAWMHGAQTGREVSYAMLPMFHAFGMVLYVTFGVYKQAHQVLFPRPDVDMALAEMKKNPPSIYCAVPPIYEKTANGAKAKGIDLSGVKWCISGAMTLPDETVALWESVSGGLLVEGYGLTECAPIAMGNPFNETRKTGTIGIPFPSTLRRVVDEDGRDVGPGEAGELWVKGPQVFQGYWNRPEATAETKTPDGWLRTGDVVTLDEDGFATIVDRLKEIIITGGFNVSPSEVERVLRQHPSIEDVAVVGVKQERGDEQVTAAVVAKAPIDEAEIRAWAKERLSAYKVPRRLVTVGELPTSMIGKVLRGQVRDQISPLL